MAGYSSPPTAVPGVLTSTQLNTYKNALDAIVNPARAILFQSSATTSIPTGATYTPIGMDFEIADTANGHSTVTNNARYVCQTGWAGLYVAEGTVLYTGNATGKRYAGIGVNGIIPQNGSVDGIDNVGAGVYAVSVYAEVLLAVGDYVQLLANQTSGGTLATVTIPPIASSLTVRWVAVS